MNRLKQIAIMAVALGAIAAAQAPAPPAPATPAAPALKPRTPRAPVAPTAPVPPAKGHSYLGVEVRDVTPDRVAALKVKEARGVEVLLVDRDAPAGKAGLKEHDVLLSYNARNLGGGEELRKLIRETPPGQTVELGISRDGQPMAIKAQLADRRKVIVTDHKIIVPRVRIPRVEVPIITTYARRNGIVAENLTPQLGEVFGVKNGEGVLIRSVEQGSTAEKAGLRAGDVIVRVGNERVERTADWSRLMREQKPGPVQLGIVRDKRQQTIALTVPEASREQSNALPGMEDLHLNMEDFGRDMEEYKREMMDLQHLQPEIERAMRESQEKIQRELDRSQREWQREAERAQREAERGQREAERAQREAQRAQEQAQREAERAQRDAQRAQEQAQRDAERRQRDAEREQERRLREQQKPTPEPPSNPPEQTPKPPSLSQ